MPSLSNRDRVGRGFEELATGLGPWVDEQLRVKSAHGDRWLEVMRSSGRELRDGSLGDPAFLLKVVAETWDSAFRQLLARSVRNAVFELRETRNRWAHNDPFTVDQCDRALDTMALVLEPAGADAQAAEVRRLRDELRRLRYAEQDRRAGEQTSLIRVETSVALPPWRTVVTPHGDVAQGIFAQAEFAADLGQVARCDTSASPEYADPAEFFRRTYLTTGLRDLLSQAAKRLAGRGGMPIVDLQTTFGGGKTHSLLALWHLTSGLSLRELPSEVRDLVAGALGSTEAELPSVRRVALVGTHLKPGQADVKPDGTVTHTMWGELAWQLGGAEAYAELAESDVARTNPGDALNTVLAACAPCLILIDEWVAYARQLVGRDDLQAGTFETHFTFAQALTEAVRATDGALLVLSIPASEGRGADEGSDLELGGAAGRAALGRLKSVIGRMESAWRPASAEESYEIVGKRLFEELSEASLTQRDAVVRAYVDLYATQAQAFPAEARHPDYREKLTSAYPLHPELFARLYNDWSTLDRFQRTRGVLRLMAAVVHRLWTDGDSSPLVMPAHLPLDDGLVRQELTRYLDGRWDVVVDSDVDGSSSTASRQVDATYPDLGRSQVARRVARTLFLDTAPGQGAQTGVDVGRITLGSALPGERLAVFGDALTRLTARSSHLYADAGRYWYAPQRSIARAAAERAQELLDRDKDKVLEEIERRLRAERDRGVFAGVHVAPATTADVSDDDSLRLVVLPPDVVQTRTSLDTPAVVQARDFLDNRGNGRRERRAMLVFAAVDGSRVEGLEHAAADYLAWKEITADAGEEGLNLAPDQARLARTRLEEASRTADLRLADSYRYALIPQQPEAIGEVVWTVVAIDGSGESLPARVSRRLTGSAEIYTELGPSVLRLWLNNELASMWQGGHVSVKDLWDAFTRYLYLPRLASRAVLIEAVRQGPSGTAWDIDGFATAEAVDASGRYLGLRAGEWGSASVTTLVVRPEAARRQMEGDRPPLPPEPPGDSDDDDDRTPPSPPPHPSLPTRYFGVASVGVERPARDLQQIASEVLTHLTALDGCEVTITLEVEARRPTGFEEGTIRTVGENARTLGFSSNDFEQL